MDKPCTNERDHAELRTLRMIVGNFLAHTAAGDGMSVDDLREALRDVGIDLSPETTARAAELAAAPAPVARPSTAGDDWTVHGHFMSKDGDRTALVSRHGQWAVLWSYAAPFGPQVVEYPTEARTREVFTESRDYSARRYGLTYDSREDWQGNSA